MNFVWSEYERLHTVNLRHLLRQLLSKYILKKGGTIKLPKIKLYAKCDLRTFTILILYKYIKCPYTLYHIYFQTTILSNSTFIVSIEVMRRKYFNIRLKINWLEQIPNWVHRDIFPCLHIQNTHSVRIFDVISKLDKRLEISTKYPLAKMNVFFC